MILVSKISINFKDYQKIRIVKIGPVFWRKSSFNKITPSIQAAVCFVSLLHEAPSFLISLVKPLRTINSAQKAPMLFFVIYLREADPGLILPTKNLGSKYFLGV